MVYCGSTVSRRRVRGAVVGVEKEAASAVVCHQPQPVDAPSWLHLEARGGDFLCSHIRLSIAAGCPKGGRNRTLGGCEPIPNSQGSQARKSALLIGGLGGCHCVPRGRWRGGALWERRLWGRCWKRTTQPGREGPPCGHGGMISSL